MFRCKVATPLDRVLELDVCILEKLNCLSVGYSLKIAVNDFLKLLTKSLFKELFKERKLVCALFKNVLENKFNHCFGNLDNVVKLGEGDFRLNVPELGNVTLSVALFSTEGGTECVNLAHCHCGNLALKLAGNGKTRLSAEEIVGIVFFLAFVLVGITDSSYLEYLACTLAVGSGEQGSVDINIVVLLEKAVDSRSGNRTNPENGVERVGSYTKMGNSSEKFERAALFLERIVTRAFAEKSNLVRIDLNGIVDCALNDCADYLERRSAGHE